MLTSWSRLPATPGWSGYSLWRHLDALRGDATALRSALVAHDREGSAETAKHFTRDARAASARAHTPGWWLVERLPGVGDDARALTAVADSATEIGDAALPGLVDAVAGDLYRDLTPRAGRIDPQAVRELQPVVDRASTAFAEAQGLLEPVDRADLTSSVGRAFATFADQVEEVDRALASTRTAVRLLPTMLGAEKTRRYLLVFNNNAEVRATGGLPGALAVVQARDGRITLGRQAAGADIARFPAPVLPQTRTENELYGSQPAVYFLDTNFMPDYDRSAALMREMWRRKYGQALDGTISVDAVTLSYLLRATGPIDAAGVRLTPENATAELLNGVYRRTADPVLQNSLFAEVTKRVFARVTSGVSPTGLVTAAAQGVSEGRILLRSFHPEEQRELADTQISGMVDYRRSPTPRLGVYLQDATGSKMSYYLRRRITVRDVDCDDRGRQTYAVTGEFSSVAPANAAELGDTITGGGAYGTPPGQQLVLAKVYGPAGGTVGDFAFDGKPVEVGVLDVRGRPVASPALLLEPGQHTTVTWTVRTAAGQRNALQLTTTPGLDPEPGTRSVPSSCE